MKVQNLKGNFLINMTILLGVSIVGMSCGVKTSLIPPRPGLPPEQTDALKTQNDLKKEEGSPSLEKDLVQKKEPKGFLTQ